MALVDSVLRASGGAEGGFTRHAAQGKEGISMVKNF